MVIFEKLELLVILHAAKAGAYDAQLIPAAMASCAVTCIYLLDGALVIPVGCVGVEGTVTGYVVPWQVKLEVPPVKLSFISHILSVVEALKSEVFRVNLFPDSKVSVNKTVGVWENPKFASNNTMNTNNK